MTVDKEVFDNNLQRVDSLCKYYELIKTTDQIKSNQEYKITDMLRAAVVFLHSSFEEYYREIIIEWFPFKGGKEALKTIVLPADSGKNNVKYYLSDLLKYKELSVENLFLDSVKENMSRISFNSYSEIVTWANKLTIDLSSFSEADEIDKAIKRRHKIVHEADIDGLGEKSKLKKIQSSDILRWKKSYYELVNLIENQVIQWSKT